MSIGPGKYDALATYVREETNAESVVVIVMNGNRGAGFSVQGNPEVLPALPDILEHIASTIRKDVAT